MFIALFISASLIQAVDNEAIAEDPRNVRSLYEGYKTLRGPILVDGKPIASSVEADDAYKGAEKKSENLVKDAEAKGDKMIQDADKAATIK
jgi:hypothetical protein